MDGTIALTEAVIEMNADKAMTLTCELLDSGLDPLMVFKAYQNALMKVGQRFEAGLFFLPELILSAKMMADAMDIIKPLLTNSEKTTQERIGKILIATVAGDVHDIGKNIVTMLMEINGFEVLDLGVDVATDKIVEETQAFEADIVGLSGLLTLAFDPMKEVVEKFANNGLRDKIKVIIGGGLTDENVRTYVGADAFAADAVSGVNICKKWANQVGPTIAHQ